MIRDATVQPLVVRTEAASRDEDLAAPPSGERLRDEDARAVAVVYPRRRPQVQIVVSDGLNANALNEQLRGMLPGVRHALAAAGHHVGERDVVVRNGRVRAGYDVGGRAGADVVVHFIGERPGTGLNTLSAYVTYGRDAAGAPRWSRDLPTLGDHRRVRHPPAGQAARSRHRGNRQNRGAGGLAAPLRRGAGLEPLTATTRVPHVQSPRGRTAFRRWLRVVWAAPSH